MSDTTTGHGPAGAEPAHPAEAPLDAAPASATDSATESATESAADSAPESGIPTPTPEPGSPPESPDSEPGVEGASGSDPDSHRFECRSCGYVYDPAEGIRKLAIEAGTPFSALDPISFRCPVCRSKTLAFRDIGPRDKPSGFEENLNFGLGVNRLTPGQKNVLIFGSFALAIAFFLSLYSLR